MDTGGNEASLIRRKTRSVLSVVLESGDGEEEPKLKDSRLEASVRSRRSSRSRITDYFPPSSIPSDVIDDIILEDEEIEEAPSEGSSSGKENDSHSAVDSASFVLSSRSKSTSSSTSLLLHHLTKMPLAAFADNVSPPSSPSKLPAAGASPSSPPTPHKIKLMSKAPYNNLKISIAPKKNAECSMPPLSDDDETPETIITIADPHTNGNNASGISSKDLHVPPKMMLENGVVNNRQNSNKKTKNNKVVSTKKRSTLNAPHKKPNTAKNNATDKTTVGSHKVTEYFPIRRSSRKSKKELDKQYTAELEDTLRNSTDDYLDLGIAYYSLKGRGIQAMRNFSKGEFVVEYAGDLVEVDIAKERESQYSKDHSTGCYMYYFKHNGKQYCVDATKDTGRLGRLVNHSRLHPNLLTKVVIFENKPRLILVARQDIEKYSELLYDYGDRSKESLLAHPWLAL